MDNKSEKLKKEFYREKYLKLLLCILVDFIGLITYLIPGLGKIVDVVWAPISGLSIYAMFPKRKAFAIGGFFEEIVPGTDIIPTATFTWINWYIYNVEKAKRLFVEKRKFDDEIFN